MLEVSEHEKDRRRKYSRTSHRGICRWKIPKNDVCSIRTFEGRSMTDPGPRLDFTTIQTTSIDGTKDIPIALDDDDEKPAAEAEATEGETAVKEDPNLPPTESIVVGGAAEESEPEVVEEMETEEPDKPEEPDDLDPDTLESSKVTELRKYCRERDLYSKGLKRELVSRLREYLEEKAKRIAEQKSKPQKKEAATEPNPLFQMNDIGDEEGDDIIVEEEKEKTEEPEEQEEVQEEEAPEEEAQPASTEIASLFPTDPEPAEPMEVETEEAKEPAAATEAEEAPEQPAEEVPEPTLALIETGSISEELLDIIGVVNELQHNEVGYWFVPDLTQLESWQGNDEDLKAYMDKIKKPMSFTQLKQQVEASVLDTEAMIVDAVRLIFSNAKEFNVEESDWYVNASHVEGHFDSLLDDLQMERDLVAVGEDGKLKYAELPDQILKKLVELAELKDETTDKEELAKLADEACTKLEADGKDVKGLIIEHHRFLLNQMREAEAAAAEAEMNANNALYVVVALKNRLRSVHLDRDIISSSVSDRTRLLILEFRNDISTKMDHVKGTWAKFMKEGPAKGLEEESIYGEGEASFPSIVESLILRSNEFYKKEKKLATIEELVTSKKKLEGDKHRLEARLKTCREENAKLKKMLEEIHNKSNWRNQLDKSSKSRSHK